MSDLDALLAANRSAVDDLIAVAERAQPRWNTPRAPGKWSPAQVAEHVARALEEAANVVANRPSKLPTLPSFIRPIAGFMLRRIVRSGKLPKAKTNGAVNPARTSPTIPSNAAEAKTRLQSALGTSSVSAARERPRNRDRRGLRALHRAAYAPPHEADPELAGFSLPLGPRRARASRCPRRSRPS